jgi:hypothetical protein
MMAENWYDTCGMMGGDCSRHLKPPRRENDLAKCNIIAKAAAEAEGWRHKGIRYTNEVTGGTYPATEFHPGAEWVDLCDVVGITFGGCPTCWEDDKLCNGIG